MAASNPIRLADFVIAPSNHGTSVLGNAVTGEVLSDGPEPIVKFEVSTVGMLQNTKTSPVSVGLKLFVGVARSGEKVTKTTKQRDRVDTDAKDFSLAASVLPLFYIQQVNGERRSGTL